jgi:hypothetical protein
LTQIQPTPFKDGIPRDSWWYWFKLRHPKISTQLAKGLEISKGGGLTKKMHAFLPIRTYKQFIASTITLQNLNKIGI